MAGIFKERGIIKMPGNQKIERHTENLAEKEMKI